MKTTLLIPVCLSLALIACDRPGDNAADTSSSEANKTVQKSREESAGAELAYRSPESAIAYGDHWIVTNVGDELKPMEKDGDGAIYKVPADGRLDGARELFADTTLHAPKGTLIVEDILLVADIDTLHFFDLESEELVRSIEPHQGFEDRQKPSFLNGLTKGSDNTVYLSATDTGDIYAIRLGDTLGVTALETEKPLTGPNGLAWDEEKQRLYIASWGSDNQPNGTLGYLDLSGEAPYPYQQLGNYQGYLDGLVLDGDTLYFSDWVAFEKAGKVYAYDLEKGEQRALNDEPIAGPADFHLSADGQSLIVPAMIGGEVHILAR
ncbi:MAG: SMP-30/gluconolactonase/LRE family protein [Pseudomonadota bacterium]